jgi:hypothetical protein
MDVAASSLVTNKEFQLEDMAASCWIKSARNLMDVQVWVGKMEASACMHTVASLEGPGLREYEALDVTQGAAHGRPMFQKVLTSPHEMAAQLQGACVLAECFLCHHSMIFDSLIFELMSRHA